MTEGQAQIVRVRFDAKPAVGRVKYSGDAQSGVNAKAQELVAGLRKAELEEVIGDARNEIDVVEETTHAFAHDHRGHRGITLGHRMEDVVIQLEVEREHFLVKRRPWVAVNL